MNEIQQQVSQRKVIESKPTATEPAATADADASASESQVLYYTNLGKIRISLSWFVHCTFVTRFLQFFVKIL